MEQSNAHFNDAASINVDSNSMIPQKKKNGRKEDRKEYCHIPFNKNEENKSIIASETIEPNARNKIEQTESDKK